jgi:hypothetical protein
MQDIRETIEQHMENFPPAENEGGGMFLELSKRWATHSLGVYCDELLTKALAISKALAEFDNELNQKDVS